MTSKGVVPVEVTCEHCGEPFQVNVVVTTNIDQIVELVNTNHV